MTTIYICPPIKYENSLLTEELNRSSNVEQDSINDNPATYKIPDSPYVFNASTFLKRIRNIPAPAIRLLSFMAILTPLIT
jgi:hypothetical protein